MAIARMGRRTGGAAGGPGWVVAQVGLRLAAALLLAGAGGPSPASAAPSGPSFDCSRVTSAVNRLICATPALGQADRKLADDFGSTLHQGGIDSRSLQADEDRWLAQVRNRCADAACLARAYAARDAAILAMSARAASPAAYAETRPFAAPAADMAAARARLGASCAQVFPDAGRAFPGFVRPRGFSPINYRGGFVLVLKHGATRFAFLLDTPGPDLSACRVADMAVLPPASPGEAFQQCSATAADAFGFGLREKGRPVTLFWSVDAANRKLVREPVGVLGGPNQLRCNEPETGD